MSKILKKRNWKSTQSKNQFKKKYQMKLLHWHPVKRLRKDATSCAFFKNAGSQFHIPDIIIYYYTTKWSGLNCLHHNQPFELKKIT